VSRELANTATVAHRALVSSVDAHQIVDYTVQQLLLAVLLAVQAAAAVLTYQSLAHAHAQKELVSSHSVVCSKCLLISAEVQHSV
jgi:hypothetical protein